MTKHVSVTLEVPFESYDKLAGVLTRLEAFGQVSSFSHYSTTPQIVLVDTPPVPAPEASTKSSKKDKKDSAPAPVPEQSSAAGAQAPAPSPAPAASPAAPAPEPSPAPAAPAVTKEAAGQMRLQCKAIGTELMGRAKKVSDAAAKDMRGKIFDTALKYLPEQIRKLDLNDPTNLRQVTVDNISDENMPAMLAALEALK